MFNLEHSIKEWRRELVAAGFRSPATLDELESHLREEIERQTRSGASLDKAFEAAVGRVGEAGALKAEFSRANSPRGALERLMIAMCLVIVSFIVLLSLVTIFLCYPNSVDRLVGCAAVACSLATACGWSSFVPRLPVIQDTGKRNMVALACILVGCGVGTFYVQVILPHIVTAFDGLLPAAGFWCVLPVAVGFGVGCGLDLAARRGISESAG